MKENDKEVEEEEEEQGVNATVSGRKEDVEIK